MNMDSGSAQTVIAGHPRFACRVYWHGVGMGECYHDSTVIVDRCLEQEYDWRPGLFGIGEGVYVAAEDAAFEVAG